MFVTFEGIEGSGKSTQCGRLAAALRASGRTVMTTREPGGTPAGRGIRRLLTDPQAPSLAAITELFLYLADRAQHVREVIRPALVAGHIVVCDRYSDSTIAYQGYGRAGDLEVIHRLDAVARDGCAPDLTFLLDCDVHAGLGRAAQRPVSGTLEDRFEREPVAFHERVRGGFLELARREPGRFIVLDGARPVDDLARQVAAAAFERLGREAAR